MDVQEFSSGLQLRDDGIWHSGETPAVSYPPDGHQCCFSVEEASFWFRHRNNCIVSVVERFPPPNHGVIFDVGGGNGFVSLGLSNAGFEVALVEPGAIGASNAKKRGIKNVICATTETARFKQRSLPAVGLFDVIEHIEGDISFLRSMRSLLKAGGSLYATVPAFAWLWSEEDVLAGHFRRYTLAGLCETLKSAGFEIKFASYIFRFLPVPVFLLRALPFRLGLSRGRTTAASVLRDHAVQGGHFSRMLEKVLKPEVDNLRNENAMKFGGSCLVVACCP